MIQYSIKVTLVCCRAKARSAHAPTKLPSESAKELGACSLRAKRFCTSARPPPDTSAPSAACRRIVAGCMLIEVPPSREMRVVARQNAGPVEQDAFHPDMTTSEFVYTGYCRGECAICAPDKKPASTIRVQTQIERQFVDEVQLQQNQQHAFILSLNMRCAANFLSLVPTAVRRSRCAARRPRGTGSTWRVLG